MLLISVQLHIYFIGFFVVVKGFSGSADFTIPGLQLDPVIPRIQLALRGSLDDPVIIEDPQRRLQIGTHPLTIIEYVMMNNMSMVDLGGSA